MNNCRAVKPQEIPVWVLRILRDFSRIVKCDSVVRNASEERWQNRKRDYQEACIRFKYIFTDYICFDLIKFIQ